MLNFVNSDKKYISKYEFFWGYTNKISSYLRRQKNSISHLIFSSQSNGQIYMAHLSVVRGMSIQYQKFKCDLL